MEKSKDASDRDAELERLLARIETRIKGLLARAVRDPGYDDEIAGLIQVRDDLLDRQRRAGKHRSQPGPDDE